MSTNPFAPPSAQVADVQRIPEASIQSAPFFAVSVVKLAALTMCTIGLYEIFWFYKNWKLIRSREGSNIIPVLRALFAVFFCYSLFKRLRAEGIKLGVAPPLAAGPLAAAWIVCSLLANLPGAFGFVGLAAFAVLLSVQSHVNRINAAAAPNHDRNAKFSALNWVVVFFGACFWGLAIIGLLSSQNATAV